jgi:hypothetical protein
MDAIGRGPRYLLCVTLFTLSETPLAGQSKTGGL